ncbi:MAG: isoprenylcysteine carboxylmethyltransferase family protein [Nanoarchaeota archaeon]
MKLKVMPPMIFYIFIILSLILNFIFPIKRIIVYPYSYLGIILILIGLMIDIWAWILFRKKRTTLNPYKMPSKLENGGPFKVSRNPMYLGMDLVLWGLSIFLGSLSTFIFPIIFIAIINRLFIAFEERNLQKVFGSQYLNYKNKVRRWI